MKKLMLAMAALPLMLGAATSTPKGFTDNLDEAMASAKKDGKFLYVCFSGSDWCGWCKKLEKEVFSAGDFTGKLSKDYVCVFIDNPNDTGLLSAHAKLNNRKLTKKYDIHGFPTALVIDPKDGLTVESTGYRRGGTDDYVKFLLEIRKDADKRKAAFQEKKVKAAAEAKKQAEEHKIKAPLLAKHLKPVTTKRNEVMRNLNKLFGDEIEKAKAAGKSQDEAFKTARAVAEKEFPKVIPVYEETLAKLQKLSVPKEIEGDLKREIKITEQMLKFMKKGNAK